MSGSGRNYKRFKRNRVKLGKFTKRYGFIQLYNGDIKFC